MSTPFNETARELVRTLDKAAALCEKYMTDAKAFASEHGRGDTAGGMSGRQLRSRLQMEVIGRLSPRAIPGVTDPPIQLTGAPEARRAIAAYPLPGLK